MVVTRTLLSVEDSIQAATAVLFNHEAPMLLLA